MDVRVPVVRFPEPVLQDPQPFPAALEGITLGVLDNQKPNATPLLDEIVARLSAHGRPVKVVRLQKSPSLPASEWALTTLSGEVDMTIIGSGD